MVARFPPPIVPPDAAVERMRAQGYAVLSAEGLATLAGVASAGLATLAPSWDNLAPDTYLRDGGRYRRRRHACFVLDGVDIAPAPHRAHWQPVEYNALHGGMHRWFEPIRPDVVTAPVFLQVLRGLAALFDTLRPQPRWYIEAHQFRIDTTDGIGRPTPEGAHRDGVDLVAVFLVGREGVKGGETRVFEAAGPSGQRFTLTEPWSLLLLDDARMIHESTPIQPLAEGGYRDTLVVTCRRGNFQGADVVGQTPSA